MIKSKQRQFWRKKWIFPVKSQVCFFSAFWQIFPLNSNFFLVPVCLFWGFWRVFHFNFSHQTKSGKFVYFQSFDESFPQCENWNKASKKLAKTQQDKINKVNKDSFDAVNIKIEIGTYFKVASFV